MSYFGVYFSGYVGQWWGRASGPTPPPDVLPEGPIIHAGGTGHYRRSTLRLKSDPIVFRHGMADDWGRIPKNIAPKTIKAKAVAKDTRKEQAIDYLAISDLMLYELTAQQSLLRSQIDEIRRIREYEDEEIAILLTLGVL